MNQQTWNNFRIKLKPTMAEKERFEIYRQWCQEVCEREPDEQVWAQVVKGIREY